MSSDWTPLRWPSEWSHPSALELVKNSPVNCILLERNSPLNAEMRKLGMAILDASAAPPDIAQIKGEWPGVRMGQGRGDDAEAGPTGVPWVDSNGWQIRLARLRDPSKPVWIQAEFPKERRVFTTTAYLRALADTAAFGGRWVLDPDPELRQALAAGEPRAKETWEKLMAAERFFAAHRAWGEGQARGIVGILSDFQGPNEFAGGELLNLTARLHQPYRILVAGQDWPVASLKSIIYADADPPRPDLKRKLLDFVRQGGLLIAGEKTGITEGAEPAADKHPRFSIRTLGKGRIAVGDLSDPYQAAADAQVLLSHRYDLLRFWNHGSLGSYLTTGPGGKGALLQIVNYSSRPGSEPMSVRVAGPYREARISLLGDAAPKPLQAVPQKDAIELHPPAIPVYAAIELI